MLIRNCKIIGSGWCVGMSALTWSIGIGNTWSVCSRSSWTLGIWNSQKFAAAMAEYISDDCDGLKEAGSFGASAVSLTNASISDNVTGEGIRCFERVFLMLGAMIK